MDSQKVKFWPKCKNLDSGLHKKMWDNEGRKEQLYWWGMPQKPVPDMSYRA